MTTTVARVTLFSLIALSTAACGAHAPERKETAKEAKKPFAPFHSCLQSDGCQPQVPGPAQRSWRENASIFTLPFLFYKNVVSPTDGPRCHHYPTCSAYAMQAVRKRGPWLGALMSLNRVTSPAGISSELRDQPIILKYGVPRFLDPVAANDFWLDGDDPGAEP